MGVGGMLGPWVPMDKGLVRVNRIKDSLYTLSQSALDVVNQSERGKHRKFRAVYRYSVLRSFFYVCATL